MTGLEIACTMRSRLKGLLGRTSFDGVLLLVPCNDIHTFGMRGPIDIAFVAHDGTVLETHCSVGPNRRIKNRRAAATLERFASDEPWYAPGERLHHAPIPAGAAQTTPPDRIKGGTR